MYVNIHTYYFLLIDHIEGLKRGFSHQHHPISHRFTAEKNKKKTHLQEIRDHLTPKKNTSFQHIST